MIYTHAKFEMFSIHLYEFFVELPKKYIPNLRFVCPMFSGDPFTKIFIAVPHQIIMPPNFMSYRLIVPIKIAIFIVSKCAFYNNFSKLQTKQEKNMKEFLNF